MNPSLITKGTGDNVAFSFDWTNEMNLLGALAFVSTPSWAVVAGSIALNADGRQSVTVGNIATTYVSGGVPGETAQLSCTAMFDTGDRLERIFTLIITDGDNNNVGNLLGALGQPLDIQL